MGLIIDEKYLWIVQLWPNTPMQKINNNPKDEYIHFLHLIYLLLKKVRLVLTVVILLQRLWNKISEIIKWMYIILLLIIFIYNLNRVYVYLMMGI